MSNQLQITIEPYQVKRHSEFLIKKLLSYAVYQPNVEKLDQVLEKYQNSLTHTLFLATNEPQILAAVGINTSGEILHLATDPLFRGYGIARLLIERVSQNFKVLIAQTDQEGVGFYKACGFEIESLGQLYPGVERFRCKKFISFEKNESIDHLL